MDITFFCPQCKQELVAEIGLAGSDIQCPSCNKTLSIPAADAANVRASNPIASSAAAREEKHFSVPLHAEPTEVLIQKSNRPLEVAAREEDRKIRVKTIRHTDCVEVGHDRFDEIVSQFLQKAGQENVVTVTPLSYTHIDIGSQKILTDYAVLIVYKG